MSRAQASCRLTGSTLRPMILQFRFSNSEWICAMYPSSVVHTGVKSFGCENRIAHPSPIHSWKWIVPCDVSAVKSGASSLMRNMAVVSFCVMVSASDALDVAALAFQLQRRDVVVGHLHFVEPR